MNYVCIDVESKVFDFILTLPRIDDFGVIESLGKTRNLILFAKTDLRH